MNANSHRKGESPGHHFLCKKRLSDRIGGNRRYRQGCNHDKNIVFQSSRDNQLALDLMPRLLIGPRSTIAFWGS
ncbi:MAG: hypothetical protein ACRC6M_00845 [Microcystaceae cyanobacterium]